MKQHWLIWIPRGLVILFGLFMLLMSIDAFEGQNSIWYKLAGFGIHNIPLLVLALIVWLTWKRPLIGGILFLALAVLFTFFFHTYRELGSFLVISGTPLLAGILFVLAHFLARKSRPNTSENAPDAVNS